MTATCAAELALDVRAGVGEAPVWDAATQSLLWVDVTAGLVHRFDPATGGDRVVLDAGRHVGFAVPRAGGGLALAVREGLAVTDPGGDELRVVAPVLAGDATVRMNDGACDAAGRLWAGSMAYDSTPRRGCLYRFDPDGTAVPMVAGATVSNGIDWSLDGRTMYYVDSPTGGVDTFAFDLANGQLGKRTRFVDTHRPGVPDGLAVDGDGCVWVAFFGGGRIERYTPEGSLDRVVEFPTAQVTSCAFGGPQLRDLFVTTAAHELTPRQLDAEPHAGAVFCVAAPAPGREPFLFAG